MADLSAESFLDIHGKTVSDFVPKSPQTRRKPKKKGLTSFLSTIHKSTLQKDIR